MYASGVECSTETGAGYKWKVYMYPTNIFAHNDKKERDSSFVVSLVTGGRGRVCTEQEAVSAWIGIVVAISKLLTFLTSPNISIPSGSYSSGELRIVYYALKLVLACGKGTLISIIMIIIEIVMKTATGVCSVTALLVCSGESTLIRV